MEMTDEQAREMVKMLEEQVADSVRWWIRGTLRNGKKGCRVFSVPRAGIKVTVKVEEYD